MRASKTSTISILVLGLLTGSTVGVAAQDEEAATEPSTPAIVTGSVLGVGELVQEPSEAEVDGVRQRRGFAVEGERMEMDDPRLTGSVSVMVNHDWRTVGDVDAVLLAAEERIENEDGSWSGSCTSLAFVNDGRPDISTCLFTGAGAYDGLSAYLVTENREEPPHPVEGLIFAGDLPPMPEMASAE